VALVYGKADEAMKEIAITVELDPISQAILRPAFVTIIHDSMIKPLKAPC
jgi:hypothetical protein